MTQIEQSRQTGFLMVLAANKYDETTRMIYADWLEENGYIREAILQRRWTKKRQEEMDQQGEAEVWHMLGKVLKEVSTNKEKNEIKFVASDGITWRMFHEQDCCEIVIVEDIIGDLQDLVGSQILMAEESTNRTNKPEDCDSNDSFTWTFYKFATIKGYVTIRWLGVSNGYYSESVDFKLMVADK